MKKLLKTHFGYSTFRPLQKEIIDNILSGSDTLVLMPTGGGKSLCFQLPALKLPGITLVISPLIALMKDQVDALVANGISAAFLNSSMTAKEQEDVMDRAVTGDLKILYIAPERLASYGFSDFLNELDVSLLAIDEAHCISEWGHDFRPDYRNLMSLRRRLRKVPVVALTATATPSVRKDILEQLSMKKAPVYLSSFNRQKLNYSMRQKFDAVDQLKALLENYKEESVIIYCFSRKNTEALAKKLSSAGLPTAAYHAGLSKKARIETQEEFIRDEVPIIVATIAFGMGIDKPDVRLVVHMDLPKTVEGYYQETGRAGRDGLPAECVIFYSYADRRKQEYFINMIDDPDDRKLAIQKLEEVMTYCQLDSCRRVYLLNYFGEETDFSECEACDNCVIGPEERVDSTEISQKIMSAVLRTGERFGMAHVCDVLRGSKKRRIIELGHDKLSVHGLAKEMPLAELRQYLQGLKRTGYLAKNPGEYPTLRVTSKGRIALRDKKEILLPEIHVSKKTTVRKNASNLDFDVELFEKLRTLRKEIADGQSVPPFVIFSNKTLYEMAFYLPKSDEDLLKIFGVGEKKVEEYGEAFLTAIKNYESQPLTK